MIYVFTDFLSPGYSKVGHTGTTIRKRVVDQGYKCDFDPDIDLDLYQRQADWSQLSLVLNQRFSNHPASSLVRSADSVVVDCQLSLL